MKNLFYWQTDVERETKRRILLTVAAYAYENGLTSPLTDAQFDTECLKVDLSIHTYRADLDAWWRINFLPFTGQWIYNHPELDRVQELYKRHYD